MTREQLEAVFSAHQIDFSNPGFYDLPQFVAVERTDNNFLDRYAEYVDRRVYSPEYLDRVRNLVPRLGRFVYDNLRLEGRLGACIDVSGMFCRILDKEGIWSYGVGGGVSVEFPSNSGILPTYFGVIGGESNIAAHMWSRIPPFAAVDLTLSAQPWGARRQPFLEGFLMSEDSEPADATVEQLGRVHTTVNLC
jgi:hypothetical protein